MNYERNKRKNKINSSLFETEESFATDIGTTVATLKKWEKNELSPSLENLLAISEQYNISTEYIINGNANNDDNLILEKIIWKEGFIEENYIF